MSSRINLSKKVSTNADHILQHLMDDCRTALKQEDPHKAIHEARKSMKKLRAFSRLLRSEIGNKTYQITNKFYRDIARKISEARDITAMLDTLNKLQELVDQEKCADVLKEIRNHLAARKAAVSRVQVKKDQLLTHLLSDLKDAESVHAKWKIKTNDFDAFASGLDTTYYQCQKAMAKAYKKSSVENFHEWRKQCKYLRYEIDFLREIWDKPLKAQEKELNQLTDFLGDDHDLAVLNSYIQNMGLQNTEALETINEVISLQRENLQKLAKPLGKKVLYESPDKFVKRYALYWKQSRKEMRIKENQLHTLPA